MLLERVSTPTVSQPRPQPQTRTSNLNPNPFPNFSAMLTRRTWKGTVMDAGLRVSIEEALQAYTEFGAFSQKREQVKGKLVPGQLADVAVFSRDLLTADADAILNDTACDLTILEGRVVYERAQA